MRQSAFIFTLLFSLGFLSACTASHPESDHASTPPETSQQVHKTSVSLEGLSKAYFASGCFWCVEAIFESVQGVSEAVSGYSGGEMKNPTYRLVSSGRTRHAEAVEVYYDPEVVSFETLVKVFFGSHDPTTPNQQGPDRGPQYRSIAFYQSPAEKAIIESYIEQLEASGEFNAPIVTEVLPFEIFYDAEEEHQNFERLHPNNQYVRYVSIPRLKKFQAKFPELLKEQGH